MILAGCAAGAAGAPILANPTAPRPPAASPSATPVAVADPQPVVLPRDDGPHDRLTEWWYYTGHLRAADGARYGFEYVIFRAERGQFPTSWASHLAITDEGGDRFLYGQRLEIGEGVDRSPRAADGQPTGFDFSLSGADPSNPTHGRAAGLGDGRRPAGRITSRPPSRPTRPRWRGRPAGSASTCDWRPPSRPPCTTTTAGSTSGRPAARTTTRARR